MYRWKMSRNTNVQEYLGILLNASGSFTNAIQYLSNKALKFIFMIRCRYSNETVIFGYFKNIWCMCQTHLLYGSELWSVFHINSSKNYIEWLIFHQKNHYEDFLPAKFIQVFVNSFFHSWS